MEAFQPVLLNVWREACRHIAIGESAPTIAPLLQESIPLQQLYLRAIDFGRSTIETVACGFPEHASADAEVRTACTPAQMRKLRQWCYEADSDEQPVGLGRRSAWKVAVPSGIEAQVVVLPIGDLEKNPGVLVFVAAPRKEFTPRHLALIHTLREPFSAALRNDQQLRLLSSLREAAEAQNQALLTRMGRTALTDTIVGENSGLRLVMDRVEMVASSDLPVLIFGETGTGKELVARAIHTQSTRASGPIIRVNCGAIPADLIDSELFGHERGAFTGAVETRRGWFERADGGTLFLDEIGDMPSAAQVRLLRILQDGWLERVGGGHPIHVDVRVVAATNRDLAAMVADGTFREDLWYRLSSFPIVLPPLRERVADIPEMARHFAHKAAIRFGLRVEEPSDEDIRLLSSYGWPGNVRELAAVIDRAAILGNGERLEVAQALGSSPTRPAVRPEGQTTSVPSPAIAPLDDVIRGHIEKALTASKGRIEGPFGAAVALEINPHTLRARMRKLGIDWKRFR